MTDAAQPAVTSQTTVHGRFTVHRGGGRSGSAQDDPRARSRIAVLLLLAATTIVFASLVSAYLVRMDLPDWRRSPEPSLLWLNTALLVIASGALQAAAWAARRDDLPGARRWMTLAGVLGAAFVLGQLAAWQQLRALGYYLRTNPSSSFFYLFTLLHGLHVLGGLAAWLRVKGRLGTTSAPGEAAASVELCALYWHFLLAVWIVLFGLMVLT